MREEITVDTLPRQARHRAIPLGSAPAVRDVGRLSAALAVLGATQLA
jgi:hypothetical protein